jgi:hypothetical protein
LYIFYMQILAISVERISNLVLGSDVIYLSKLSCIDWQSAVDDVAGTSNGGLRAMDFPCWIDNIILSKFIVEYKASRCAP